MFDWNDLRYFLAVARTGSTVAAAKALDVSQPTVQRRLAALDEQIGCKLFEHHPTGYRLTDLGAALLPHAERVQEAIEAVERQLQASGQDISGVIRVTCPEADLDRLLMPILNRFEAAYPGIRVEFVLTDRALDLAKGEADIALRGGEPREKTLIGRKLVDVPWFIYASRAYIERHGKPECHEDIARHTVIAFAGQIEGLRASKWLRSAGEGAAIAAYGNSVMGLLSAVKSGVGLTALPAHLGDAEVDLVRVLDPGVTEPFTMLVHPDLRNAPRLRAFLDFVAAERDTIRSLLVGGVRTK